jgi:hypothetical protein
VVSFAGVPDHGGRDGEELVAVTPGQGGHEGERADVEAMRAHRELPALTFLTLAPQDAQLRTTWQSLEGQSDPRWCWVVTLLSGDAEPEWLAAARAEDHRIRIVRDADVDAGRALVRAAAAATGEVLMPLAPGDVLAPNAVAAVSAGAAHGNWVYGDEFVRFPGADRANRWEKPAPAPEWLRTQPPLVITAAIPRASLVSLGGLDPELGTAAWYDAVLRLSEQIEGVGLEDVVVRRDDADTWRGLTVEDAARAVRAHCDRVGVPVGEIEPVKVRDRLVGLRLRRRVYRTPTVSIVVPTRGSSSVVRGVSRCHVVELVRSVWGEQRYAGLLEFVVVYDEGTPRQVLAELADVVGDALVLVPFPEPFNFSRKCNVGAVAASGELVCFLNDDIEVISEQWLDEMVAHLDEAGVGAVGARLLLADGTLQHVGHQYDGGVAGHPLVGRVPDSLALGGSAHLAGERSGVTAACLLVRRSDLRAVGGFSELLPLNYNDVDLCLKIRQLGLRVVCTPHAELYHFESQTRIPRALSWERSLLQQRWASELRHDPYLRTRALAAFAEPVPATLRHGSNLNDHGLSRGAA